MNIWMLIISILLLIVVLGLTVFAIFLVLGPMITGFKKAPYVPSFDSHLKIMKQHLKLKKGAKIVDLGCGDGKALRFFSREFGLQGTGYDLNPFVIRYGKLLNKIFSYTSIRMIRSNFKKARLQEYEYIYLYLFPEQLRSMEDWVFDSITPGTIIISNSFVFAKHTPTEVIKDHRNKNVISLYKKI